MDIKDRRHRSLTRGRCGKECRYTSSSLDSEDCRVPTQKSYSSSETLKAYDHDSRMHYGNRVTDLVHRESDEFPRQGMFKVSVVCPRIFIAASNIHIAKCYSIFVLEGVLRYDLACNMKFSSIMMLKCEYSGFRHNQNYFLKSLLKEAVNNLRVHPSSCCHILDIITLYYVTNVHYRYQTDISTAYFFVGLTVLLR